MGKDSRTIYGDIFVLLRKAEGEDVLRGDFHRCVAYLENVPYGRGDRFSVCIDGSDPHHISRRYHWENKVPEADEMFLRMSADELIQLADWVKEQIPKQTLIEQARRAEKRERRKSKG